MGNQSRKSEHQNEEEKTDDNSLNFFIDHIPENYKKHYRVTVASISEALCFRIRKELPFAQEIAFCSDNARNYNNNTLPLILPIICKTVGLKLTLFLHPDACCGKSCADAHLALSLRHVKRYIMERCYDVLTPGDVVEALIYEGVVKNTFVDNIKVHHEHWKVLEFEMARKEGLLETLGTPCGIRYEHLPDGHYLLKLYTYSNCSNRSFIVRAYESSVAGKNI